MGEVPDSFSVTAGHGDRLASQAERLSQGEILRALDFLAVALAAVKDGSEPRLQLEMALLKATQPQADLSLQTLIFRIEQLERRLGGEPAAENDEAEPAAAPASAPAAQRSGGGPAAAVVVEPREEQDPQPAGAIELEQVRALWPAVAETVGEENGMLGAAIGAALPTAVEGERLTVAFPADAAFVKKKAEANRELVVAAVRGLTGHSLALAFELSEDAVAAGPATLDHDQLIERLRQEFGAEEVFEEPEEERQ